MRLTRFTFPPITYSAVSQKSSGTRRRSAANLTTKSQTEETGLIRLTVTANAPAGNLDPGEYLIGDDGNASYKSDKISADLRFKRSA